MKDAFAEVKLFQVRSDKLEEFEAFVDKIVEQQRAQKGCVEIKYMKRFFIFDKIGEGELPRELTKIVKCVKYYSYWEFDTKNHYAEATAWLFEAHGKAIQRLLIMPFDINCGHVVG